MERFRAGPRTRHGALLARGADPNASDTNGYTALHCAIEHVRPELATRLLREPVDLGLETKNGETARAIALRHGLSDLATRLGRG